MSNTINYTNQYGIDLKINEKTNRSWFGEMTGWHEENYTEFVIWQGKHIIADGFDTLEDAKKYADTIEF